MNITKKITIFNITSIKIRLRISSIKLFITKKIIPKIQLILEYNVSRVQVIIENIEDYEDDILLTLNMELTEDSFNQTENDN